MTTKPSLPENIQVLFQAFGPYGSGALSEEALHIIDEAGVNVRNQLGQTLLMSAARAACGERIEFLLESKCLIDEVDEDGFTALHHIFNGWRKPEITQKLIEAGANLEIKDATGMTPLVRGLYTSMNKKSASPGLMILIEGGADLEAGVGVECDKN